MASINTFAFRAADMTEEALSKKGVALVDFFATWCMPCRAVAPIIEQIADEYAGKAVVGKIDIDEEAATAEQYGVQSIPTMIIFKDGKEAERIVGARNKAFIVQILNKYI